MSISAPAFFAAARAAAGRLEATQLPAIRQAGERLAGVVLRGGVIQVFGTGHSRAFAMEMANRAGGLVPVHAMDLDVLFLRGILPLSAMQDADIERDPANAHRLLAQYDIRPEDGMVIVSNSGRNGATVEMALAARQRGLPVVAVTAMAHTTAVSSRHPGGQRLYEVADIVIDNCGPLGDALLPLADTGLKVCSVSSITGALIAQGLTAEITGRLLAAGLVPPVLISANVDGGDAHNAELRARYAGRI